MPLDAMAMAGTQEMAKGLGWEVGDQNTSIFYMTNKVDPVSNPATPSDLMAQTTVMLSMEILLEQELII